MRGSHCVRLTAAHSVLVESLWETMAAWPMTVGVGVTGVPAVPPESVLPETATFDAVSVKVIAFPAVPDALAVRVMTPKAATAVTLLSEPPPTQLLILYATIAAHVFSLAVGNGADTSVVVAGVVRGARK